MNLNKLLQKGVLLGAFLTATASYATDPHWTYDEQLDWGALENADPTVTKIPELYPFAQCGLGQKQSPIDISRLSTNTQLNPIKTNYTATGLSISNNGHTIKVNMPSVANVNHSMIGRESFELLQFHFHAPSEHTINGKTFPLELHFVHGTPNGKLAVLGVLIKAGMANAEFQKILDNAPTLASVTNTPANETIDPSALLPQSRKFYSYAGSLTTPPCTEGVDWYVLTRPIEVSSEQLAQFEALYADNARHPQALNGRQVEKN
ncbi:MAG: carbonic anhydrase family protein [Methylococcaceae bacterium]